RCVPRLGLNHYLVDLDGRKLPPDLFADKPIGDDPERLMSAHRKQAFHGFLDHGLGSIQCQNLFGQSPAATRPETRTASACQNHRIEMWKVQEQTPRLV